MGKSVSAVICTYNRADYLGKAIQSLVDQSLDNDQYEIIIVNNRSTDHTEAIVQKDFSQVKNLHYLYEPVQGLSQARNTGTSHAKGKYIAFLDDDAIACDDWLERIVNAFENKNEPIRIGSVGGKIDPIWEIPRPVWLSDDVSLLLTILDWFDEPTILAPQYWLAGANIAFPKSLLEEMGGFEVALGRKGSNLLSNEETVMRQNIEQAGYGCLYDPQIFVQHHVPAERLTKKWFRRRRFWGGVSKAVLDRQQNELTKFERVKCAGSELRKILLPPTQLIRFFLPTNNPKYFARKCALMARFGYLIGMLGIKG